MPTSHHQIDKNQLFPVQRRGDTLIVSPKGDPASFASLNYNLEHAALLEGLRRGPYANLLVDLSGSNYFGAKVVGAIAEWAHVVADKGGRAAVCGVSEDMRELLHIYELENQWQQFPSRQAGIKALVKETPLQALRRQWRLVGVAGCFLVLLGIGFLLWQQYSGRTSNRGDYQTVMAIWTEMQELKSGNAPPPEWRKLRSRAKRELEPMLPRLESRAGMQSQQAKAAQCLLFATRDYILSRLLVERDRLDLEIPTTTAEEIHWEVAELYLEKARRLMDGEDASDLTFPQLPEDIPSADGQPGGEATPNSPAEPAVENTN